MASITKGTVIENSAAVCLARVRKIDGTLLLRADVDSISAKVFNLDTQAEVTPAPTLLVADCIFDTLQTDARWSEDATGYNFAAQLSSAHFPDGNTTYQVEIKIIPDSGEPFYLVYDLDSLNILSE